MKRSHCAFFLLPALSLLSASAFAQTAPPAPPPPAEPAPPPPPPPAIGGGYDGPPASSAPAPTPGASINLTTLRILKDKGIISQAEYDSAIKDMGDSLGAKGVGDANTIVVGKWATTLYGFIEQDSIYDSTQSLNDLAGNAQIAHGGTYAQNDARVQFGIRNSRLGLRLKAPEFGGGVRTSAVLETDFLGNQMPVGPVNPTASAVGASGTGTSTEGQFFTNPTMRVRHAYMKIETPVVDFLFGQYWDLYGWQQTYAPNTVEIQGLPGQIYSRTPQIRISKTVKNDAIIFELAAAAMRPPQRDSAVPEGQGGIRLGTPAWTGLTTGGATGTGIQPLSIAVTGDVRSFTVPPYTNTAVPTNSGPSKVGTSIAVDGYIPIIPAKKKEGNALSVTGEFSTGYGNADLYTGLTGGAPTPNYSVTTKGVATTYSADIDPGFVVYDSQGNIHLVQWTSYIFGLQYYLPATDGNVWISLNYSNIGSNNLKNGFGSPAKVRDNLTWYDANIFWQVTESYRLGIEAAMFQDKYVDGTTAQNIRGQFSNYFIF